MAIVGVELSVACFAGFAWAICRHFQQHEGIPAEMRLVSFLSLAGFVCEMPGAYQSSSDTAYCLLVAASLMLFWLSISATKVRPLTLVFAADVPTFLQHDGPYKYLREPVYLLFWIGTALASSLRGRRCIGLCQPS